MQYNDDTDKQVRNILGRYARIENKSCTSAGFGGLSTAIRVYFAQNGFNVTQLYKLYIHVSPAHFLNWFPYFPHFFCNSPFSLQCYPHHNYYIPTDTSTTKSVLKPLKLIWLHIFAVISLFGFISTPVLFSIRFQMQPKQLQNKSENFDVFIIK